MNTVNFKVVVEFPNKDRNTVASRKVHPCHSKGEAKRKASQALQIAARMGGWVFVVDANDKEVAL